MNIAFVALGSNLAERETYLKNAIQMLQEQTDVTVTDTSSVYETAPVGYTDQGDFLNMVIRIETALTPLQLLDVCQSIEAKLGRERVVKWGPRTIDLDILLYNQENIETERLTVPHPHQHERAFVMVPLAEVAPGTVIPTLGRTVQDVIEDLSEEELESVWVWKSTL